MGRSRFPGKPLKFQNRKRISVLSGVVYNESATESHPPSDGASANVFTEEKEEEEKEESKNQIGTETRENNVSEGGTDAAHKPDKPDDSHDKSPVRTRSQNKMDPSKGDKPKAVKKTVTFGTVESCEDTFLPLKKLPSKHQLPLVPIIKKKSALKQTEYSSFSSILKPAKLTDLSSKSSEHHEGYLRKNLNPLSKPINKFSQFSESRCLSPPPRNASPIDKEGGSKFVLPLRSSHSSRVIKPNKKFLDGDDPPTTPSTITAGKLLKKPKLKRLIFNNIPQDDDSTEEDETEKPEERKERSLVSSLSLFKDKTINSFPGLNPLRKSRDLFSFDKEQEFSQDENSNLEALEKLKMVESQKESGHALRKLVDISDASSGSGSGSSSGSESEESWDSAGASGSGGEEGGGGSVAAREAGRAPSQLLSGKVIIREARLQLSALPPPAATANDGPFSTFTTGPCASPTAAVPTTVDCGVCGAVRFYKFVKQARKFGIYSCESCRKFISKMIRREKLAQSSATGVQIMHCLKREGNCYVPPIVRSQQWKFKRCANKARCPACWLKMCLKAFQVPPNIRAGLTAMLPTYMRGSIKPMTSAGPLSSVNPANPLRIGANNSLTGQPMFSPLASEDGNPFTSKAKKTEDVVEKVEEKSKKEKSTDETSDDFEMSRKRRLTRVKVRKKDKGEETPPPEDPKRQKVELKGPRVKHVCRSASIVLGQPIATFPTQEEKDKDKEDLVERDEAMSEASCDTDAENKPPQAVPEVPTEETELDVKKRKVEVKKAESSEDETVMELVPRKTVMKPLTNITNSRGRPQKCDQNRPELICVDFWESYDPDEVCSSGFGVIGSAPFTVPRLCFLCGSAGKEKMLVCTSCCESYHYWCAEEGGGVGGARGARWTCARCVQCAACGRAAARVACRVCARHYHAACLPAPPGDRSDWPQICSGCLKCKSCESSKVSKFVGSLPFCAACFRLRQKGNYCPLCQACYRDNDFDSKMMECGWCSRWVHARCEGLSGEGYQLLSALPPHVEYTCRVCQPATRTPPWRSMIADHLKGRLLHLLKLLAKNKKACALLKLTPHKNTPVPDKQHRLASPQAIRKLHFDDSENRNITETKVYRNTRRTKPGEPGPSLWQSSILNNVEMEDLHTHKVVNLQEPLMQNKEICFSTTQYGVKTENDTCVEVHENEHPDNKTEMSTALRDDKYDAVSDDDEPGEGMKEDVVRSEQDLSPVVRLAGTGMIDDPRHNSPSLLDIKKRVNNDEYNSLKDFNREMREVIERVTNVDLKAIYKDLFTETFPWFDCDQNCLQPNLEVEGELDKPESMKDQEITDCKTVSNTHATERTVDQIVPKLETGWHKLEEDLLEFYPIDTRSCILCKAVGDASPAMEGRLLYCGQNDWIHANCALWSAEVFEEIDGSLQNVHSAISRGKMIKCAVCELKGASVGCCAKNCGETYHYACARNNGCAFMDDKRVFCPPHGKDIPKKSLQKDADFELTRPVYVELDKKKKRYSEISKVQFLLGSLTVQSLGKIVPSVSDFEEFLMPVDFSCTRLFWSIKKPTKVVRYTIRTKLMLSEPLPGFDFGVNITVDHTMDVQVVERVMAEIGAWHKSVESGAGPTALMRKHDRSPRKIGNVTLEDLAVKQVMEYLLDSVCRAEAAPADEDEPQSTADLLPPELKDAIFEDLNHDLLDGISMQDIFPKLMSYEDLVAMDLKNEFYGAMTQSDDKSNSDSRSTTDFIDELLNARLESGSKELKRSKSEMLLQNHNLKTLTTGRGQQRSSSLTWSNKFDTSLLSSTIKRCKMGRTSTVTGKQSPVQRIPLENPLESIKEADTSSTDKKPDNAPSTTNVTDEGGPSGLNYRTTSPKQKDLEAAPEKSDKAEGYYTDVIDFYTKIQCSPIAQLDGSADWSGSESTCSSRPTTPNEDFSPIQQLDGADDSMPGDNMARNQNQFLYRASGSESTYTVTIAGNSISGQPELVMRPLDEAGAGAAEQPVRCDRCQCTYRNKESYDRHVPSCDMMSTSESESENPKSPENRTLTTLQNAFQGAFAQPMIIHTGVVSGTENTVKAEGISARRTSINTRQITINGTIVETPTPGQSNEMTMTITEQMKSGTVIFDQSKTHNVQVSANQQVLSQPQIVVTPQMLMQPKTSSAGQKIMAPQIISQPGMLPYNICVKPGNGNPNIQQIQGNDMTQLLSGAGGIQVLSNSNQVLTIPNQQGMQMMQGKNQVNFPNMASASSIALPVNSLQGMPGGSIIQNIQPMIRPNLQGNQTIVMPAMTAQRLSSPNSQNKQHILMPATPQKSPKKQTTQVQPKPIFQAANRPRGRPIPKPTTIKRQTKLEKTYTTINQPLGAGNTVIQLQTNNQTGQPSIIVQPVANQNIMSAYVEALSQQQNQNMQYIATLAPQNDFKTGPTQFISNSGFPQTFQIQQTENGGLVAVPSGGIPVLLPQGNMGILPQTIQQGTLLPQGLQQGIISQGPNGPTLLPQAIHTQNGTTIIPQGAIQGLTSGNLTSQATLLPTNTLHTSGATVVPQSGIGNTQTTLIPNGQGGNTLISSGPGTILPNGTLLPQFCNDQVLLGSAPTLEMVTDPNGCMYLTTTQPVYYGLETIVQNTVMSSQQFVSTAMQGVLAQNSSFSATTTQVFQASKIEPIVEVPTGYVVVNNVGDGVNQNVSTPNVVTAQTVQSSPQTMKNMKAPIPNLTLQPLPDKSANINRQTPKLIQMGPAPINIGSSGTIITGRQSVNPITSQIQTMSLANSVQNISRASFSKPNSIIMSSPNVTLVSSMGQPVMAISHAMPHSAPSISMQPIPMTQPIVSSSVAPSINKNMSKIENSHVIEIGGNLHEGSSSNSMPTISVTQTLKSPTPWRQVSTPISNANIDVNKTIELQNMAVKTSNTTTMNVQNNIMIGRLPAPYSEHDKNVPVSMSIGNSSSGPNTHLHQFESNMNVSHHSTVHNTSNNVIQISSGNIYPPSSMTANFDSETALKLSKINALSKAEGGHLNFSQEIMASHSQQHAQNEKTFQNIGNTDKHNEALHGQMNIHKLNSCQMGGNTNNPPTMNIVPHTMIRQQALNNQNSNQMCSVAPPHSSSHGIQMQPNSNVNMACQEAPSNRVNISSNENNMQQPSCGNQQNEMSNVSMNATNSSHGNVQMMSHESHHATNQIHIMNGQIQHNNRPIECSSQIQQTSNMINQSSSNRSFHENIGNQMHNQANMLSNRATPDNINMNQSINMHMGNNHLNRSQNEINHMHSHSQQSMTNMNIQNNRMTLESMQGHAMNNMSHQMHANRSMDNNMHNQIMQHNVPQMGHHMNNNRQQIDSNLHVNQQMPMQQNRQMDSHHHQHPMPNVMQLQNNRQHMDSNMMGIHGHMPPPPPPPGQLPPLHARQMEPSMHMHHMPANNQNMVMSGQIDGSGAMTPNMHNRHDNNTMNFQTMNTINSMNQMQGTRSSLEHPQQQHQPHQPHLHQMNNISSMNNINMHASINSSMQAGAAHPPNLHGPPGPEGKPDLQSCGGSCANTAQYSTNQTSFDMCASSNMSANPNMNIAPGNMMHSLNNSANMSSNLMMGSVNNAMYSNAPQSGLSHDMLMSCNNVADHSVNNHMPGNTNHMMMNNAQHANNNQNQMLPPQVPSNAQININSCSMNSGNAPQNQIPNIESQVHRNNLNEPNKFEPCRGKNIMASSSNANMGPIQPITSPDCSKVNIVNNDTKQSHTISVNNQMGFMPMNAQNNRVINLPERNRNNPNLENNINQHMPQQHNIRVVTNNSSNVAGLAADPLGFQQKNEANSTMINVPFQAIPNSAPMNINVNSSNNTVNITVQNNLVDPKIASNILPNQNTNSNMICIPVQSSTINLPSQNSTSITLPKAPSTQQSGIPTNVVNPMSMRPMNRVLPLHRDGQSKTATATKTSAVPKTSPVPKPTRPVSHDMPDLNMKDDTIDSDLEKAIEESKRMMELEKKKKEQEERDAARAIQLSTQTSKPTSSTASKPETPAAATATARTPKISSLPNLDVEMEEPPKVLAEKDTNKAPIQPKLPTATSKVMKRPLMERKTEAETITKKLSKKGQENIYKGSLGPKQAPDPPKDDGPKLIYEVSSEDGFNYTSTSLSDLWAKVVEAVQNARKAAGLSPIPYNLPCSLSGAHLLGLNNNGLRYLVEQLPGASRCTKYKLKQNRQLSSWDNDLDLSEGFKESPWGSARIGPVARKGSHDMFSWMASPFREEPPPFGGQETESSVSRRLATLPMAMRFRHLKETSKASVGVYRSHIHGRGLFCKRDIEEGDMVIEYAGEVIRAVLADQREKRYEAMRGRRGVAGCYMFRIDDHLVVDATLKGNAARFINHSCDPNCYSRVVDIHGHKHILIFALRRISVGEELTYDYKFPFEEVKIPCTCGAKKCRKYLN